MKQEICSKCPIYNDGLYDIGIRHNIKGAPRYVLNEGKKKILCVAEAFGEQEDIVNQPLVGRSGKLLDQLLQESGLSNYHIKFDNVVKCRPIKLESGKYKNRTPTDEEILCCHPYLDETLSFDPDLIILFGNIPFKSFFPDKDPSHYRGKGLFYNYNGKDIMTALVYHPAACLYNPSNKPILLNHLKNAMKYLEGKND